MFKNKIKVAMEIVSKLRAEFNHRPYVPIFMNLWVVKFIITASGVFIYGYVVYAYINNAAK